MRYKVGLYDQLFNEQAFERMAENRIRNMSLEERMTIMTGQSDRPGKTDDGTESVS